jgi:hypothetical protein
MGALARPPIFTRKWLACHFLEMRRLMARGRAAGLSHKWDSNFQP